MARRQHSIVQDTHDDNACIGDAVEDNVPVVLAAQETGPKIVTSTAQTGSFRQAEAKGFQFVEVLRGLTRPPEGEGVTADIRKVPFGATGETKRGHRLLSGPQSFP